LKKPVSLDAIKADPRLAKMALVTNARLSVQPVTSSAPRAAYDAAS
jgi:predicted RNA-binding protein with PUA-like domain